MVGADNERNATDRLRDENGAALMCSYCSRPVVVEKPPVCLWIGLPGDLWG
jgi:hypothetical protein